MVEESLTFPFFERIKQQYASKHPPFLIIDAHFLPFSLADIVIVTSCSLPVLKKRLVARGYGAEKVRENIDAEIFETCLTEAKEQNIIPLIFDSSAENEESIVLLAKKICS